MCASAPPSTARGITVKNKRNAEIKTVSGQRPRPLRRSRASSPKVGALGSPRKLHLFAKASPFEERLPPAGGRCRAATKGGVWHGEAVTERASQLKNICNTLNRKSLMEINKNGGTMPKTKTNDPGAHHASSGALIRRFLPYLANYKMVLCLDLFCAALTTLCDIVLPKIMSIITNSAMGVGITLTAGIVLKLAALYFVLRIIDGAASYYMSSIGHIMGVHIETDMRRDAFDHLLQLDHTYYNNTKVGTIMGRITNDLFDVTEFAHHCPEEFFIAGIKIVASFVILCRASIPLTLAVFACVPLMGVVSVYLNGRLRARFRQQRVQIGELNSTIEDSLLGQGVVKAFAAEDEEREKFAKGNRAFEQIKTLGYYAMGAFNTSTRLFDGLMYLVVILAGGLSLVYGKITAGDMVAYMLYVTTLIATIRRIVEFAEQFQRGMTGIERFAEIMDTPVAIKDAPDAVPSAARPRRDPVREGVL